MICENGPLSLSYVVEFEWHRPSIRLLRIQDVRCLLECVSSKPNTETGACLLAEQKNQSVALI